MAVHGTLLAEKELSLDKGQFLEIAEQRHFCLHLGTKKRVLAISACGAPKKLLHASQEYCQLEEVTIPEGWNSSIVIKG